MRAGPSKMNLSFIELSHLHCLVDCEQKRCGFTQEYRGPTNFIEGDYLKHVRDEMSGG